jgi:CRISPR-associated protein Cas1
MTKNRVLDISNSDPYIFSKNNNLVLKFDNSNSESIVFSDIAVCVLANPKIVVTKSALAELLANNVIVVICDNNYLPIGMFVPFVENSVQTLRFNAQANLTVPTKKRLWQQIVRSKIRSQAGLLVELLGDDFGLQKLSGKVLSGDTSNVEAQAARIYWDKLFPSDKFSRDRFGPWPNSALNYGYTILRAIMVRAICGSGLHPTLGLHHHNRYDYFCLADDLMEPLRQLVDRTVMSDYFQMTEGNSLLPEHKKIIIESLYANFKFNRRNISLFDVCTTISNSLLQVIMGEDKRLVIPNI